MSTHLRLTDVRTGTVLVPIEGTHFCEARDGVGALDDARTIVTTDRGSAFVAESIDEVWAMLCRDSHADKGPACTCTGPARNAHDKSCPVRKAHPRVDLGDAPLPPNAPRGVGR